MARGVIRSDPLGASERQFESLVRADGGGFHADPNCGGVGEIEGSLVHESTYARDDNFPYK